MRLQHCALSTLITCNLTDNRLLVNNKRVVHSTSLLRQHSRSQNPASLILNKPSQSKCAAASSTPTDKLVTTPLYLEMAATCIPHPDKVDRGGEDAYFLSPLAQAFGVADGVGGWQESGIDPGDYSRDFMMHAKQYLEQDLGSTTSTSGSSNDSQDDIVDDSPYIPEPKTALDALRVGHKLTKRPGSATAIVLRLDTATGELDVANLGDSGFLLIRNGQVEFTSPPLQHFFDCPFQFGAAPEYTPVTDTADDATVFKIKLVKGDVIVAATDGLLDNCFPNEIAALAPKTASDVQSSAQKLAELGMEHGLDPEFESPYSIEATEEGIDIPIFEKLSKFSFKNGQLSLGKLTGGKLDDVTVVVAYVGSTF